VEIAPFDRAHTSPISLLQWQLALFLRYSKIMVENLQF